MARIKTKRQKRLNLPAGRISVKGLAQMENVDPISIRRWMANGTLPSPRKLPGEVQSWSREEIMKWKGCEMPYSLDDLNGHLAYLVEVEDRMRAVVEETKVCKPARELAETIQAVCATVTYDLKKRRGLAEVVDVSSRWGTALNPSAEERAAFASDAATLKELLEALLANEQRRQSLSTTEHAEILCRMAYVCGDVPQRLQDYVTRAVNELVRPPSATELTAVAAFGGKVSEAIQARLREAAPGN